MVSSHSGKQFGAAVAWRRWPSLARPMLLHLGRGLNKLRHLNAFTVDALSVATGWALGEAIPGKFVDPGQLAAIGTRPP